MTWAGAILPVVIASLAGGDREGVPSFRGLSPDRSDEIFGVVVGSEGDHLPGAYPVG